MAISIDTVYQRVLALANKEQRGYVTPQEFNLMANQAQVSIFESYFYDMSQRAKIDANGSTVEQGGNISELIAKKLDPFTAITALTSSGTTFPPNYATGKIFTASPSSGLQQECVEITTQELNNFYNSPRHRGYHHNFGSNPVFVKSPINGEDVRVYGGIDGAQQTSGITCETINKPASVDWGYVVVNEQALYNSNTSTNFTLHDSEEDTLVFKILELAGIIINKPGLTQIASGKETIKKQTQKQ